MIANGDELKGKLEIIASRTFPADDLLVDVVDFLNKSLKKDGYIFGVSMHGDRMNLVVYETERVLRD